MEHYYSDSSSSTYDWAEPDIEYDEWNRFDRAARRQLANCMAAERTIQWTAEVEAQEAIRKVASEASKQLFNGVGGLNKVVDPGLGWILSAQLYPTLCQHCDMAHRKRILLCLNGKFEGGARRPHGVFCVQ